LQGPPNYDSTRRAYQRKSLSGNARAPCRAGSEDG
jgi:hypothetical protein